jgi:hypothetical protein
MTPRPWDFTQPDTTQWWLVPSTEWPEFRFGKIICGTAEHSPRKGLAAMISGKTLERIRPESFFVGVHIEKGYGREAVEVISNLKGHSDKLVGPGWLWGRLISPDGAEQFAHALRAVAESGTVDLYIRASFVHEPDSNVEFPRDVLVFPCSTKGLDEPVVVSTPIGVLHELRAMQSFPALAKGLEKIDGYHWVDVYAGTYLRPDEQSLRELDGWLLSHFNQWLDA